ncbi:hypothetical protein [Mesorhizobium sp. L2C066B000]|uniref:hypothetical protein n=1 Tax=Mesorhizobium sp. L2C066B000 TaxID=1287105 RepID=UPI0012DEE2A5|nr:hypothetical protein [Mesorhizobium sp. L2C066B000]
MYHYVLSSIKFIFNKEISDQVNFQNGAVLEPDSALDCNSYAGSPDQAVGPVDGPDNRERSDAYRHVAFHIDKTWRVIVCPDGIQWILQKRKGNLDGRPAWNAVRFCRTKSGLCGAIRDKVGGVSPEIEAQLAQLPDWVES